MATLSGLSELRQVNIETALSWAYREELPKRDRRRARDHLIEGPRLQPSPMARMMAHATAIDSWSRAPGLLPDFEDAHPDALIIEAAVHQLRAADLVLDRSEYAAELAKLIEDADQYGNAALSGVMELVMVRARLGSPPPIPDAPRPGPVPDPRNGKPSVRQLLFRPGDREGEPKIVRELPAKAIRQGVYPKDVVCPLRWFPEPSSVVRERADYLAWWLALEWLAGELRDLQSLTVTPPLAPRAPWSAGELASG
jgi:hypothetical protein